MSSITISGFTLAHAALNATQGTGITPIERLVLSTLSSFANFLSECWPSNQTLADRTGLHERTVGKAIGKLQEKGLIERKSRGQGRAMLTRILIPLTPPAQSLPPPAHGLPEPARNLLQIPIAATEPATPEPQHQHAHIAVSPPLLFISEIPEQPDQHQAIPEIDSLPDYSAQLQVFANSQYAPTEAPKTLLEPSKEAEGTDPTTGTNQATQDQAIEADPLASVPAQLLADFGEVRRNKKKAAKVTRTEAKVLAQEAAKANWSVTDAILWCVLRGYSRFSADWVQHVPPQTAPAAPKVWQPEPHTPASPSTIAQMREKIAAMKARWNETPPPLPKGRG